MSACDSSCSSCVGDSKFCLTCSNSLLASGGKCIASCPSTTFTSSGTCTTCHSDCATCSGPSFNQCSSCPSSRPVLTGGRCLATCAQNQYFDRTSSSCLSCDPSCSSCSASGPSSCLACSSANMTLAGGSCTSAGCPGQQGVIPGLGLCLATLVVAPPTPAPALPGISSPPTAQTPPTAAAGGSGLPWWQILLMVLGCVFIFVAFLICCRRRARKNREKRTQAFAANKKIVASKGSWRWRLVRFGEKLFGHAPSTRVSILPLASKDAHSGESMKMKKLHLQPDQHDYDSYAPYDDVHNLIGSYAHRSPTSTAYDKVKRISDDLKGSGSSMYAQKIPRRTPEPRQPVREGGLKFLNRFTMSSHADTHISPPTHSIDLPPTPHLAKSFSSEAETYAEEMRRRTRRKPAPVPSPQASIDYLEPDPTGMSAGSGSSNNPFRNNRF